PGLPVGLPGLPTPDNGPAQPVQPAQPSPVAGGAPAAREDTGELPSGPMVLAVRCASGHHNAPHATRCRVCGQELPTQQPEQTPRPALGLLRLSTGDIVTLDRGVLIGRAPRASAEASGARAPHLVRIASPDNEISRNHVEIVLDGWHVLVRDLGSTNGTTVALPGSSPVRVRPGDQQTIEPGTTITLADQVSMVFEVTG
ncbi:MAG TPA: FHA domain-containing protein, partial [Candidatus Janibacter merdipullorum]|nr:FHA domain-containing protein [Candidatus Janibacter merdipullorum]